MAVVSSVKLDTQRAYTVIQARPTAGLQRLRYLLLLWGADRNGANPMTPEEVHRVANERLMQMMPQVLPSPDAMGPKLPEPATGITQPDPQQPATVLPLTALHKGLRRRKVVLNRLHVRREGNSGEIS